MVNKSHYRNLLYTIIENYLNFNTFMKGAAI